MNNEFMDSLIEQNPDAMIFADTEGTIRVWNVAAERVFGFTKEDAIGSNLDIIVPQNLRKAHWRGYEQAMQRGKPSMLGSPCLQNLYMQTGLSFTLNSVFLLF